MSRLSKTGKILAAAGIAFGGVLTADAVALAEAIETGSPAAVESFIVQHSESEYVGEALIYLAESNRNERGFNSRKDKGRPNVFGPHGRPRIGAPGQYRD